MTCIECDARLDDRAYRGDEQLCTACFDAYAAEYLRETATSDVSLTTFDRMCAAQDVLDDCRREYGRGLVHFETFKASAVYLLTLRRDAEIARFGKAKTKINAQTIASIMRG